MTLVSRWIGFLYHTDKEFRMTTLANLTIHQILGLRQEAAQAGDDPMVVVCTRAISGDQDAAAEVVEAINDAAAMNDGGA